jgi:hypothetical protein
MSNMTVSIKTPDHEAIATKGCEWVTNEVADTVVLTGWLDGEGVMVPQDGPRRVLLECEVFAGWCRETGERKTVVWTFEASSRISAMQMLVEMAQRTMRAALADDEWEVA